MNNFIKNLSLAKKLSFLTLFICALCGFTIIALVYNYTLELNSRFLDNELREREAIIKRAYIEPLWSFDQVQIEEVSHSLLSSSGFADISAIRVSDPKGNILFDSSMEGHGKKIEEFYHEPFSKIGISQIKKNDEIVGVIEVAFTTVGIIGKYEHILERIFFISCFIVTGSCLWMYIFFNKTLTRPLEKVLSHVEQLKKGHYEQKEYGELSYELKQIAETLNYTSTLINRRNKELKDYSLNLEKTVAERTIELQEQILKNVNANRLVAVGEVASGIAHEINNPLTVISGQVIRLKRILKDHPQEADCELHLNKITLMSERMVKIINGLKLISRDGQSDPMKPFSMTLMLEEIKLLTEMKIKSQGIDLSVSINGNCFEATGREVQISQVLVNLINNAVDAVSTLHERWIKIEITDLNQCIEFKITDSGTGIPDDLREKIMTPFFTTKEVGKGTGLGLSISKGIIKEHGGVFYYNENSPNTQFIFTLGKTDSEKVAA